MDKHFQQETEKMVDLHPSDEEFAMMIYYQELCDLENGFVDGGDFSFSNDIPIGYSDPIDYTQMVDKPLQEISQFPIPNPCPNFTLQDETISLEKETIELSQNQSRFKQLRKTKTEKAAEKAHIKHINLKNKENKKKKLKYARSAKRAVTTGNMADLKAYIQSNPDEKNDILYRIGYTAIGLACVMGKCDVVEFLLNSGADPHQIGMTGTALDIAVDQKNHEIISLLMDFGCKCDDQEKFYKYFESKSIKCVKSARKTFKNEAKRE